MSQTFWVLCVINLLFWVSLLKDAQLVESPSTSSWIGFHFTFNLVVLVISVLYFIYHLLTGA